MPPKGTGASGGLSYEKLQNKYLDFSHPMAEVLIGGKPFKNTKEKIIIGDIHVDLSSGFEASVATFRLYNVYDPQTGSFRYKGVKKQIMMGNSVEIRLGYLGELERVFVGFISGVSFSYEELDLPCIEVTAMDVKGIMMGGSYATSIAADNYGNAVKEILKRTGEGTLKDMGGITEAPVISRTPDADSGGGNKSSPLSVEMVNESDYEFVVRAAKRFNFEFFIDRGKVIFRPAKSDNAVLMTMGIGEGLRTFHIEYSITGVVGKVEARAMDPGAGKVIAVSSDFNNTISTAQKAKKLVGNGAKVYLDASIFSAQDAETRVKSLMEQMSYRLGSIEAKCVGIPELVPGKFVKIEGMGTPVDNTFYITRVTHDLDTDAGYGCSIEGCAAKMKTS